MKYFMVYKLGQFATDNSTYMNVNIRQMISIVVTMQLLTHSTCIYVGA